MSIVLDGTSGITTPEIVSTGGPLVVNASAPDNSVVVDASGNVGIGTGSPQGKTESKTAAVAPASPAYGQKAFVANIPYATANITSSLLAAYDTTIHGVDVGYAYNGTGYDLIFATNSTTSGSPTERARIDSSGNLLVGTTSDAPGSGNTTTGCVLDGALGILYGSRASGASGIFNVNANSQLVRFHRSGLLVGNISVTTTATAFNTTSDYRLKHDIAPMTGALAKVAMLKPCTYKWNADNSEDEGFIAHELAEVCPSAVSGEKDAVNEDGSINPQGIDTSFLVATLTAAIQELKAINDAQAQTIESLTARVVALEQA